MVDDNILSIIIDACTPLFDLLPTNTMKPADLLMSTAKLLIAAGFMLTEQARQEMAEEDLGGGIFDQDVKDVKTFASKCSQPQVYEQEERMILDTHRAIFDAPASLSDQRTGTKLYTSQLTDSGREVRVRVQMQVLAPAEEVVGYFMGHAPQFNVFLRTTENATAVDVGERSSDHSVVTYSPLKMPSPFLGREAVVRSIWERLDDNTFFVAQTSCEHRDFPFDKKKAVRISVMRAIMLTKSSSHGKPLTKLELFASANLGGSLPPGAGTSITAPFIARSQIFVPKFFASTRPSGTFDAEDGKVLGQLLIVLLYPHRKHEDVMREKIDDAIRMTNVLRSAQAKYRYVTPPSPSGKPVCAQRARTRRFFDEFILHVVRNKLKVGASQTSFSVDTPLVALTANEAARIGKSFAMILMTNTTPEVAVDELVTSFHALGELDREFVWFRPMLDAIATELLGKVAYGVQLRAFIGAAVSILDLGSDLYMVNDFFNTGRAGTAKGLLCMMLTNLAAQLAIVFVQTRRLKKNKWKKMLTECLSVVTFTKPGVDAYRVASGADVKVGQSLGPVQEMIAMKAMETVFEVRKRLDAIRYSLAARLNSLILLLHRQFLVSYYSSWHS
jgi:hypothetical protein